MAKRKPALLESNPPRNSHSETHRNDEWARRFYRRVLFHRSGRFPHASENSRLCLLKRHWCTIAKRGMRPFPVVIVLQKLTEPFACIREVAIPRQIHFLALQCAHEALCDRIDIRVAG